MGLGATALTTRESATEGGRMVAGDAPMYPVAL
jgi:hypothetical protein